ALGVVDRRFDRAHDLARRVLAVHAGHRHEGRAGRCGVAGEVRVDAEPVHLAAAEHLVPPHGRDVVLRLAGDDARLAVDAGGEVDRHPPAEALGLPLRVEALARFERGGGLLRAAAIRGPVDRPHDVAPLHAVVAVRARETVPLAGPPDLDADPGPERVRGTDRVAVVPVLAKDAAAAV